MPQDVEADDKLLGPFSFRQFCYLMVATAAGFLAFMLGRVAIPLALIPAPVAVFFLAIALPLRKDQPTEIYLAAVVRYWIKSRTRMWQADGEQPLVEISSPIVDDTPKTKDLAGDEVSRRLSFLANLSDTQGWSTRGISAPVNNTNLTDEFASDAVDAQDIMEDSRLSDSIGNLLDKSDRKIRSDAISRMNQLVQHQAAQVTPASSAQQLIRPAAANPAIPTTLINPAIAMSASAPLPQPTATSASAPMPATATSNLAAANLFTSDSAPAAAMPTPPIATSQPTVMPAQQPIPQPNYQPAPVMSAQPTRPAVQPIPATPLQPAVPIAPQPQRPIQPAKPVVPVMKASAKPGIMNDDKAAAKPSSNPVAPVAAEPIIDIKLH